MTTSVKRALGWATSSVIKTALLVVVGAFLVIQLVPYGRAHSNPPVTRELSYDSPRTQQLVSDACGACHTNATDWPIESNVAPFSWLIQHDVEEGRSVLNFSEWDRAQQVGIGEVGEVINEGEMPPVQYKLLHPNSRLSDADKADLIAGRTDTQLQPGPARALRRVLATPPARGLRQFAVRPR